MWQLLKEKTDLSNAALTEAILAVDASDGRSDGKLAAQPTECRSCGRKRLSSARHVCLWCGELMPIDPFGRRLPPEEAPPVA